MDAYTSFAEVYDMFMDNIPYEDWCGYLTSLLKEYGINDGLVLDLGCGTGELTRRLAACGYDMTGVDVSVDMLQKAMEKQTDPPILYLLQEMQTLERMDVCGQSAVPVTVSIMCLSHRNFPMHSGGLPPVWKAVEYLSLI